MKIAILGSGGREHAIAATISKSSKIENIYCIPGNAGTLEDCHKYRYRYQ
jgi:phosphoribosylamine--glycine ligase